MRKTREILRLKWEMGMTLNSAVRIQGIPGLLYLLKLLPLFTRR
jgi:hypothetical protein